MVSEGPHVENPWIVERMGKWKRKEDGKKWICEMLRIESTSLKKYNMKVKENIISKHWTHEKMTM